MPLLYLACCHSHEDRNTEQERKLVDDITAPGGIKAAPPRDSLNRFIARLEDGSLVLWLHHVYVHMYVVFLCEDVKYWTVWQL